MHETDAALTELLCIHPATPTEIAVHLLSRRLLPPAPKMDVQRKRVQRLLWRNQAARRVEPIGTGRMTRWQLCDPSRPTAPATLPRAWGPHPAVTPLTRAELVDMSLDYYRAKRGEREQQAVFTAQMAHCPESEDAPDEPASPVEPSRRQKQFQRSVDRAAYRTIFRHDTPDMGCQVGDRFTHLRRVFTCVGHRPHTTRDGRAVWLAEWESTCAKPGCGRSFIQATHAAFPQVRPGVFSVRCPDHRARELPWFAPSIHILDPDMMSPAPQIDVPPSA